MKHLPETGHSVKRDEQVRWARYESNYDIRELEDLRPLLKDQQEQKTLEEVISRRKRQAKGEFEALEKVAEFFDKSAIPLSAAFPTLAMFLATEHVLDDPARFYVLLGSYMIGGVIWGFFRWLALRCAQEARRGLADLGRVD